MGSLGCPLFVIRNTGTIRFVMLTKEASLLTRGKY